MRDDGAKRYVLKQLCYPFPVGSVPGPRYIATRRVTFTVREAREEAICWRYRACWIEKLGKAATRVGERWRRAPRAAFDRDRRHDVAV